ncbi:Uma2 family endonuclease [Kovacikia minuta CCNUW1]|uniref:Uma2 family endonuclease n=1 Tax=Kovacikia minuta TaxID=2931930 RepID=UPI001CCCF5DE|nr:Uma2 family endonuclease [Kovacikia minuta]UBF24212.1 Uma2 family endonuclease [Kovacikia minuta CCNUW1]
MNQRSYPIPQMEPPLSPRETLPTMYDLPSEDPEESGLPDEFHDLQPQLLSATLRLSGYARDQIFTGTDLNLYYDVRQPQWYKRPDWFLVVGVPRLYDGTDLRSSYVIWQEGVDPFVVIELLSPGTEKEDLGEYAEPDEGNSLVTASPEPNEAADATLEAGNGQAIREMPPRKWEVYEQILRVPYYIVFSRYTNRLRFFQLTGGHYQEQPLDLTQPRIWISELKLGLGLWRGEFEGVTRHWLRWYDEQENWIPTSAERAMQAEAQLRQVALNLLQQGMTVEQIAQLTGLSLEQVHGMVDD